MTDKPDLKIAKFTPPPKKGSESDKFARTQIENMLASLSEDGDQIVGMFVVAQTSGGKTIDFFITAEEHSPYSVIGAIECAKRDFMRQTVESRTDYVKYEDLE